MKKQNTNSTYETLKHIRKDWNGVNPVTKVIPNKKKNRKLKHKGREFEDWEFAPLLPGAHIKCALNITKPYWLLLAMGVYYYCSKGERVSKEAKKRVTNS